jgi:cytochrome c biogenesis protein CcdA
MPSNQGKMSYPSFYLYGVGYATASTACTLPVFLLVVVTALTSGGLFAGIAAFAAYSLGKGVLMIAVTVATATSKTFVVDKLKAWSHKIPKITGAVLVLAGIYVAYYQLTNYILV